VSPDFKPTEPAQFSLEEVKAYEDKFIESKKEEPKDPEAASNVEFSAEPENKIKQEVADPVSTTEFELETQQEAEVKPEEPVVQEFAAEENAVNEA
jgi:hypothetical protein